MAARKSKIEYCWAPIPHEEGGQSWFVNWRLVGANGEIMCQSTQGYRDKTDARRSVDAVTLLLCKPTYVDGNAVYGLREVGPGRKPA